MALLRTRNYPCDVWSTNGRAWYVPQPGGRKLWCRAHVWPTVSYRGRPYSRDSRSGWCEPRRECFCLYYDKAGFILQDGNYVWDMKAQKSVLLDYHAGNDMVQINDPDESMCNRFDLASLHWVRSLCRHWLGKTRAKHAHTRYCWEPWLVWRSVLSLRATCRGAYQPMDPTANDYGGFVDRFRFLQPARTVVKDFTRDDMLRWDATWADSGILYLEIGTRVVFAPSDAPVNEDGCGWVWVEVISGGAQGWMHPGIVVFPAWKVKNECSRTVLYSESRLVSEQR